MTMRKLPTPFLLSPLLALLVAGGCHGGETIGGPRDRFWRHHVREKSLLIEGGINIWDSMQSCLDEQLTDEDRVAIKTLEPNRRVVNQVYDEENQRVVAVHIESAIVPEHAKAVQALARCVRQHVPGSYEARAYYVEQGLEEDDGSGGNNPTHLAPLVGMFFPDVMREMMRTLDYAHDRAEWGKLRNLYGYYDSPRERLVPPDRVGFRASEHLTYNDFKEGLTNHTDGPETYYTMNYAFSGPDDYSGGEFTVLIQGEEEDQEFVLKPNKYDALVLLGGLYSHGVKKITSGTREMFSNELWEYPDLPFGSNLWAGHDWKMRKFIYLCDLEEKVNPGKPCTVDINELEEDDEFYSTVSRGEEEEEEDDDEFYAAVSRGEEEEEEEEEDEEQEEMNFEEEQEEEEINLEEEEEGEEEEEYEDDDDEEEEDTCDGLMVNGFCKSVDAHVGVQDTASA